MGPRLEALRPGRSVAVTVRLAVVVSVGLLALASHNNAGTFLGIAVMALLAMLMGLLPAAHRGWGPALVVFALAAGLSVALTGEGRSPLLPLLVLPQFEAAAGLNKLFAPEAVRPRLLVPVGVAAAEGCALLAGLTDAAEDIRPTLAWLLIAAALGVVTARPSVERAEQQRWEQARRLVAELDDVVGDLAGSLDPETAADALLADCARLAPVRVGAVLRAAGDDRLVPQALRGADRVPWSRPLSSGGPLAQAFSEQRVVREQRTPDTGGQRRGSDLLVIPLRGRARPVGLLVLDSAALDAFEPGVQHEVVELAASYEPRLEASLVFDELRERAVLDERERLAREMHDGVAQMVAAIGFEVDRLGQRVARDAPEAGGQVEDVRALLDTLSNQVRVAMIDLRTGVSATRGLATAAASYLRSVASATGLRMRFELQDNGFRLPGPSEEACYRLLHEGVTAAREAGAGEVSVRLEIAAPRVRLTLTTDAPDAWRHLAPTGPLRVARRSARYLDVVAGASEPAGWPELELALREMG